MPEELQRPGFAAAMRLERDHLFDSGHFSNAPTLMRLLAFLVEETLAGRGDQLKSYSVAVDGLGRDPEFDSQADSYPRVQVVRLRKLLEVFYARHEPAEHSCIFLKSGSYRVRLAPLAAAYPELARAYPVSAIAGFPAPETEKSNAIPVAEKTDESDPALAAAPLQDQNVRAGRSIHFDKWYLFAGALLLLAVVLLTYVWRSPEPQPTQKIAPMQLVPPVLLLEPVSAASDARSVVIADDVYALLADGIGRSWLVRLRLANGSAPSAINAKPQYRITAQMGEVSGGRRPLYLRLTEYDSSNLLWSTNINITPDMPVADSLGQAIAQLTGPFGVIAARESRIAQGRYGPGYSCLLGYLDRVVTGNSKVDDRLSDCLAQQNADVKLDAVRLAFQSFHVMSATSDESGRQDRILRAMNLARQSIKADPKEANGHFAMARIHFVTGNCAMGQQHSGHAMEANPYDAVILAILGNFAATCGYKEGLAMLDKAYAFRSPGESHVRLSLILAAIWQKRFDRLEVLREDGEQTGGTSAAYHYLCETLIAAALDETAEARANWQKFKASPHSSTASDDAMLQSVVMAPDIRARILGFLKQKNVLSAQTG